MRSRSILVVLLLPLATRAIPERALQHGKPQPPIRVGLRALAGSPGELRVAVEVRTSAPLTDMRMIVRLEDRARGTSRQEGRALEVAAGATLREELLLRDVPGTGTLLVGVEGRLGDATFNRTAELQIGTPAAEGLAGRARADAEGRAYLDVAAAASLAAEAGAAISGTASYEDKPYNRSGFTGGRPLLPIRFAAVQLVAEDNGSVVATTSTDARGSFTFAASPEASRRVHVAVTASSVSPYAVQVVNSSRRIYSLAGPAFAAGSPPGTQRLKATQGQLGGVFNMLDAAIRGSDLVLALSPGARFPALRIFWQAGATNGTFYNFSGIHVLGTRSDPDEYDDDVVLHEFGHYVADKFSWDTSPGGDHDPFDDQPEPREVAWSEGFASWFSSAARGTPSYVDNSATGHLFFELEGPTPRGVTRGEGNEIAVGAILWDISDPANEPHDAMDRQRGKLWDVTSVYFPQRRPASTLDAFCEGWIARSLGETSALGAIFRDRGASCP